MQKNPKLKIWAILFWLAVWEIASLLLHQPILLVSPVRVVCRTWELAGEASFWRSILFSLSRIAAGFALGLSAGAVLAALAARWRRVAELLAPVVLLAKTIPVASFVILALIWVSSRNLSVLISFLMVFPILYTNLYDGIRNTDRNLLEMAAVFEIPPLRRVRYIYLSEIMPSLRSAVAVSLGLCWKSGIAAEVIGIPRGSIGEKLYNAKIYINTADVFAWTLVIVLVAAAFEHLVLWGMEAAARALLRDGIPQGGGALVGMSQDDTLRKDASREMTDVSVTDLKKSFGDKRVFDGYFLRIPRGEVTCVSEPSGWGKTTLLRILIGAERADGGAVTGLEQRKKSVAFQEDRLCEHLSAVTNIRLAVPRASRAEVLDAMTEVGLAAELADRPVRTLSGGQKRRVAILRALLADYDFLALDEPFRSLDDATREQVIACARRRIAGRTVLLVTHDPHEAELLR